MTPYILNYNNEAATFPAYTVGVGNVNIKAFSTKARLSGSALRNFNQFRVGDYLLCLTGDQTSELRKITGFDRNERALILESAFTLEPTDQDIRIVTTQVDDTLCVFNNGAAVVYVDGQELAANDKILWTAMNGQAPFVLYGTSTFQVANGDIVTPVVIEPDGQPLTRVDDTNVTITLGGTPATALLEPVSLTMGWTGTLAITRGGTGAGNASDARTNLGATTVGGNYFTLANPSAVSFPRMNADNTVTARTATELKTDLSLNNVENTALSTWAGSTNITTLGTITTGTWSATAIALNKITAVTASRALVSDGSGFISASAVTATELGYLAGVTSAIQTQLDSKAAQFGSPDNRTAQTAAIAATTIATADEDGFYQVCFSAVITTAGTTSILGPFQVRFTSPVDAVVKTFPTSPINFVNQTNANTTGAAIGGTFTVYADAGTAIQYIMGYTSTGTVMNYALSVVVVKI